VITAASALQSGIDQLNYDPKDLSLGEETLERINLLNPVKGVGSLFTKPGTAEGGEGGGGGDGSGRGTDILGRPFFDPGFGSPAQNLQFGGTGAQAGVQPVTTQPLAPPPALPGIPSEADFSAGFDFGTDFGFNQGGLVSLLPRFQNGGEVSFRQRQGQRPLLGWDARRVESTPEQWDPDAFPGEKEDIRPTRHDDLVPSELTHPAVEYLQEKVGESGGKPLWLEPAAAAAGILGKGASKFLGPASFAYDIYDQFTNPKWDWTPSWQDRMRALVPFGEYFIPERGYIPEDYFTGSPPPPAPAPFFDPGLGSPPPPPPGEGSPPPPPSPESHAADRVSLPGIPSEADFSAGFDFNQGGLVSLLPRRATPVRSPPISYRRY
jgi:hypothetical protein